MPSSVDVVVLGVAAVLAVVALVAAIVALRAVREAKALRASADPGPVDSEQQTGRELQVHRAEEPAAAPQARVIEGRVIIAPTPEQLVAAQMTRPSVRIAIVVAGVMHALRPESRDRIGGLMRREYRRRRRARQRAARRASRVAPPPPGQTDGWMSS